MIGGVGGIGGIGVEEVVGGRGSVALGLAKDRDVKGGGGLDGGVGVGGGLVVSDQDEEVGG